MDVNVSFKPTLEKLKKELKYHKDKVEELNLLVKTFEKCVADEENDYES